MGQKVNPIGFRIGVNKTWKSKWFATGTKYRDFLVEDKLLRDYVEKKCSNASLARIEIERAAKHLKVNIYSARPGLIIGKKGAQADQLKEALAHLLKIKLQELTLNIFEVKKPDLSAPIVADSIKQQLERRVSFRRAMKKALATSMKMGAKGIKVQCSGRLGGADMSRVERYHEGRVPLHTLRADIDYANTEALTTYGQIGVKVWIYRGDIYNKDLEDSNLGRSR